MTTLQEFGLQLVIDSIPAMAWSARADGTGAFFNRRYLDYVGMELEQVRDWQWLSVIHPDDVAVVLAAWEQLRMAPRVGEVEARMRRHDGVYRWFSFRSNPVRGENGNVIQWYGINVDIEERKRASRASPSSALGRRKNCAVANLSSRAPSASPRPAPSIGT